MDTTEADNGAHGARGGHGPTAVAAAPQAVTAAACAEERDMDDDDDGEPPVLIRVHSQPKATAAAPKAAAREAEAETHAPSGVAWAATRPADGRAGHAERGRSAATDKLLVEAAAKLATGVVRPTAAPRPAPGTGAQRRAAEEADADEARQRALVADFCARAAKAVADVAAAETLAAGKAAAEAAAGAAAATSAPAAPTDAGAPQPAARREDAERAMLAAAYKESDEQQAARISAGAHLALEGVYTLRDGEGCSMRSLRKAVVAATSAVTQTQGQRPYKPSAGDAAALWATAPRQWRFDKDEDDSWVAPPRSSRPGAHPRVISTVVRNWHRADGCADCSAGRECYITSLRRNCEELTVPFKVGMRPTSRIEPAGHPRPADMSTEQGRALFDAITDLENAGVVEDVADPSDFAQCAAVAVVHMAAKQGAKSTPEEIAACASYDTVEMEKLAQARGERFVARMAELCPDKTKPWSREAFEQALTELRGGKTKWRLVVGLNKTVNDLTEDWPFRYVDFAAEFEPTWTTDDLIGKLDAIKGFYSAEIKDTERRYFCFRDPRDPTGKKMMRYKRLPMGFKLSPAIYSALTSEVARHLNASEHGLAGALYRFYVDDLAIKAPAGIAVAAQQFAREEGPKANILWGSGPGKDEQMAARTVVVGREFCSDVDGAPMVRATAEALFKSLVDLAAINAAIKAEPERARFSSTWLRSLAGRASWVAQATYSARLHMGSVWYAAAHADASTFGMVRVGNVGGLQDDAAWFLDAARDGRLRGERYVRLDALTPEQVVRVFSDASGGEGAGCGVYWSGRAMYHSFTGSEVGWGIAPKELAPVVAAARAAGESWRGKVVVFHTDNLGNAYSINTGKCVLGAGRELLKELYRLADAHGFEFVAVWLPRSQNVAADAISKAKSRREAEAAALAHGVIADGEAMGEWFSPGV